MMRQLLFLMLSLLSLSFINFAYAEKADDSPVDNKSTYHLSDNIELISKSDVQYDKPHIVIKLAYPKLASSLEDITMNPVDENLTGGSSLVDSFNAETTTIIQDEIQQFKQRVAESTNNQAKPRNRLTVDYSSAIINLENQPIISIRFIIQGYIAGTKQPYRRYRTLNFDMESGTVLQLSDLFKPDSAYLAAISAYASKDSHDHIPAELLNNWNINVNGLRFTFDEASIAPLAQGSKSVLIPYSKLSAFISKDSALGKCLEHRKSCMRDSLLTGGFIDEAANSRHRRLNPALG